GASIDPATGAFTWTPTSGQVGTHPFTVRVTDGGLFDERSFTITVTPRATTLHTTLVYVGDTTGQYSDQVALIARLTDTATGALLPSEPIAFQLGTQSASAATAANGEARSDLVLTQAAGSYTVSAAFAGDGQYAGSSDAVPFAITREAATS